MSILVATAFPAIAKAVIVLGRQITAEESATLATIKTNAISQGEQVSTNEWEGGTDTYTTYYSNATTAQAVVTAAQAFTPAPISATVVTV
jgi:hypothetical protein